MKDELIKENNEFIEEQTKEIGEEFLKDTKKEIENMFRKAFRGNKNIKFR